MSSAGRRTLWLGFGLSTALRATEGYQPAHRRIYDAAFDRRLTPPVFRVLLLPGIRHALTALMARVSTGTPAMLLCRTRFTDDALKKALDDGIAQVVCLGAGFDSRAYRLPGITRTRCFELDLPESQELKKAGVRMALGALPAHVTYVPIDFNRRRIADELPAAGFRADLRSFFVWEGVTQYISAEAVDATLTFVAAAAPGSRVTFTYIKQGIIDGTGRSAGDELIMARVARRGMPWVFGLEPDAVEDWLAGRGLLLLDHAGAEDYRARYLEPAGRGMPVYEGERIVLAEVLDRA